jgi:hypothetical protein
MSKISIVIPTHKRENIITTNIYNQILCIHESEKENYKSIQCEKIYHNETGLSNIRQFIYSKFENVFMCDDDIVSVEKVFTDIGNILDYNQIYELIQETYYTAKNIGVSLFGFNNTMNPKHYKPQKPFVANGYINACAFGLLKDENLYFSKKTIACESHWINLLNAYYNRKSFMDTRYAFRQKPNSTFTLEGGQTLKRTIETEKRDTLFLKMMFGDSVKLKKGQNDARLHHEYQRKLNIRL